MRPKFMDPNSNALTTTRGFPGGRDYRVIDVPADGSCMFHAVFVAFYYAKKRKVIDIKSNLGKMKDVARRLRLSVVTYVLRHYRRPLGGVAGNSTGQELVTMEYVLDPELNKTVRGPKTYADYMTKYTVFGGETELHALSSMLKCGIVVHPFGLSSRENYEEGQYINAHRGSRVTETRGNPAGDPVLHVHFDEVRQHYAAIVPNV